MAGWAMTRRGEAALAALFLVVGVGVWAAGVAVFEPALRALRFAPAADHESAVQLELAWAWTKDVRWTAMVLALGGLVLLTRRRQGQAERVAATGFLWAVGDILLDVLNPQGWLVALGAGAGAAVLLGVAARAARRQPASDPRVDDQVAVVYSGILGFVALLRFGLFSPGWGAHLPYWQQVTTAVLPPLLVVAAVLLAATAPARVTRTRLIGAAVIAIALGITMAGFDRLMTLSGHEWNARLPEYFKVLMTLVLVSLGLISESRLGWFDGVKYLILAAFSWLGLTYVLYVALLFGAIMVEIDMVITGDGPTALAGGTTSAGVALGIMFGTLFLLGRTKRPPRDLTHRVSGLARFRHPRVGATLR